MNENINLQEILTVLKKRMWLIMSTTIAAIAIVAVISYFFLTPIYQASTQILVNQQNTESEFDSSDIQTTLQLINTYYVIIKTPIILSQVIENLDLDVTPAELNKQLTVSSEQNSQVVNLTVQDSQAHRAVDIANTTAEVFQKEIVDLMRVDNVNILSPAILSENAVPIKPNKSLNIAIATLVGLVIGIGISFLLEYLDTTVKTEQDIDELLELPILGIVSTIPDKKAFVPVTSPKKESDLNVRKA